MAKMYLSPMLKKPTQADSRPFPVAKLTRYSVLPSSNGLIIWEGFHAKERTKACIQNLFLRFPSAPFQILEFY